MILLSSSDRSGLCYIETKNLDGETNLKHKNALRWINKKFINDSDFSKFDASITCEHPNDNIYTFFGHLNYLRINKEDKVIPLSIENFLLRGSSLRNTDHIYGFVVFTGYESKIMKNSSTNKN